MQKFLIVDDNTEQSSTVLKNIKLELAKLNVVFEVEAIFPFVDPNMYNEYITANNVCVVILDEKLNERANPAGTTVNYMGHNLVTLLREKEKDLPIYTITNYGADADVQNIYSEYDHIINRNDFYDHTDKYVPIMVRAAQKFSERSAEDLSEFNDLARQIAGGNNDPKLIEKLKALQTKLELPFTGFDDRKNWLDAYEKEIAELETLKTKLTQKINGK